MKAACSLLLALFCGILFCLLAYRELESVEKAERKTGETRRQADELSAPGKTVGRMTGPRTPGVKTEKRNFAVPEHWLEKQAGYCLVVRNTVRNRDAFLDLRTLCVPGSTANGVTVYDDDGKRVRIHQYDSDHLLLPGSSAPELFFVYYGFPSQQPLSSWDPKKKSIPPNFRLRQQDVMRRYPDHPSGINQLENLKRNIPFLRVQRELWKAIGTALTEQVSLLDQIASQLPSVLQKRKPAISSQAFRTAAERLNRKAESTRSHATDLLESTFFSHFKNRNWGRNVSRIFFTRRPFDTDRNLLTCFSGMLSVPEDGDYEFRLNTNSTRIFRVNGKTVLRRFGQFQAPDTASIGTVDELTLPLKHGSNFIEFLYYKGPITNWAAVSWRKKGEGKFQLLSEDDFAPASPVDPLELRARTGEKYPIVRRNDSLALFTGKHNPYSLDHYEVLNRDLFKFHWEINGKSLDSSVEYFAMKSLKDPVLRIVPDRASGYSAFDVPRKERVGDKAPLRPDLSMKIWSPCFLYDDEYADLTLELNSGLPINYTAFLSARIEGENPFITSFREALRVPAMPMEHDDRFAQNPIIKRSFHLEGKEIAHRFIADFSIAVPELEFDRCGIVVSPVKELPELKTSGKGLCDESGRKVLVILHRMSLHEVRAWELLKKIESELRPVTRVLVVAENFNGFKEKLEQRLNRSGIALEFVEWKRSAMPSGSAALETIPEVIARLKTSRADAAFLIPLALDRHGTLGVREERNAIAMLLELFLNRKEIRTVFLSTPFPLAPRTYSLYEEMDRHFGENLRKLKREKGLRFLELDAILRRNPAWTEEAYTVRGEKTALPHGLVEDAVEILASEIEGK